jgi:hypothetical protein
MKTVIALLSLLMVPLTIANLLGGVVGGIWLAFLGEWGVIGWGIGFLIFSALGLGIAMMPGMLITAPGVMLAQRGREAAGIPFLVLGTVYQCAVLAAWCPFVLYFFVSQATSDSLLPVLIWSYGAATGPISHMAGKEEQAGMASESTFLITLLAQVGYVVAIGMILFAEPSILDVLTLFGSLMVLGVVIQCLGALSELRALKSRRDARPPVLDA